MGYKYKVINKGGIFRFLLKFSDFFETYFHLTSYFLKIYSNTKHGIFNHLGKLFICHYAKLCDPKNFHTLNMLFLPKSLKLNFG